MDQKKLVIGGCIALGVAVLAGLGFLCYKHCHCKSKVAKILSHQL